MNGPHYRAHHENEFHGHPLQGLYPLIGSIVLAIFLLLLLVPAVR